MLPLPMSEIQSLTLDSFVLVFTKPYSHVFISWRAELIFRVQKICNDDMFHVQVFSKAFNLILEKKSDAVTCSFQNFMISGQVTFFHSVHTNVYKVDVFRVRV